MCPRHTAKTRGHTAKTSPTMADGKAPTAATGTAKTLFAVCQKWGTRQTYSPCVYIGTRRKKASRRRHGQLTASAAVRRVPAPWTHGEHPGFAVCPNGRHTAKLPALPCAAPGAHGEVWSLCRVLRFGTRQSDAFRPAHTVTLPCAMATAHGKATEETLFFWFFRFKGPHSNIYQYIYQKQHARHYI